MANVIDTLIVKLGLDNNDFQDKIKDAEKQTKELDKQTNNLTDSMRGAVIQGTIFGNILSNALGFIADKAREAILSYNNLAENLRLVSRATNQSIEDFQRWSYAIEYSGGSVQAFQSTFEKLSKQIRQAPFTHNSTFLRGLSELGVNVHNANGQIKSMSDLLLGLAGRLGGMSEGKAFLIGQRLGLDDDTIRLLREGKDAVQAYLDKTKEDGILQKQNLEIYERLRKARVELSKSWSEITIKIGNFILPLILKLTESLNKITDWLRENSTFIKHTLELLGIIIGAIAAITLAIGILTKSLFLLKTALWGLGIGAIILLWDDFMTYLEGGDSVIGRVMDKIKEWGTAFKEWLAPGIQFAKDMWEGFVDFFAQKIEWCINLYHRFASKINGLLGWAGMGSDIIENVNAMSGGSVTNQNVSNTTATYDFRGSSIMTRATNAQSFYTDLNTQIANAVGGN
jgi:hypothetical protein